MKATISKCQGTMRIHTAADLFGE